MDYAELRCKSAFSFQWGASQPEELYAQAQRLGLRALGLADINSLAGVVRAHRAFGEAAKAGHSSLTQLLIGAELHFEDGPPILTYAQSAHGYRQLCRLLTEGRRAAPKGECFLQWSELFQYSQGLIAILLAQDWSERFFELREVFGDRLYWACQRHLGASDELDMARLEALSKRLGVPLVAVNDVHYHHRHRQDLQDLMTCIRSHKSFAQVGRAVFPNAERCLKSGAEMLALFGRRDVIERSLEIAERCEFSLDELEYQYPDYQASDAARPETASQSLRRLAYQGVKERFPEGLPRAVRETLEKELKFIKEQAYEPYFLTVYDLVEFARERKILCQGRGSAANSVVCYCLGITDVDPRRHQLLFERFISAERGEPPDIDVDFEHQRREEVIQYIYEKYSRERAGMTATVITYRRRSALRDIGRAFGHSQEGLSRLVSAASGFRGEGPYPEDLKAAGFDLSGAEGQSLAHILRLSQDIQGFPRHLSQHVGGLIMTKGRLDELVPIENASMPGRTVIEWDKDDLETLGLLKVDVLALGMLSALSRAFLLYDQSVGEQGPSLKRLAEDNPRRAMRAVLDTDPGGQGHSAQARAVYDMLCQADTVGVFQVESRAQMSMLPRLRPRCFYDLVIEVSIVRPGPIQGGMVNPYLLRRQGREPVEYWHKDAKPVLKRTLGVPLFQEQVMALAVALAGFTATEADGLRRAMGAWRKRGLMGRWRRRLLAGFAQKGLEPEIGERIVRQIEGFGEYGFPESHAASFALIVFVSSWFKRFAPAAFAAALLNSQPLGFYTPAQLLRDARDHGVELRPIDVNVSAYDSSLEGAGFAPPEATLYVERERWGHFGPALRLGLRLVKGLAEEEASKLLEARERGGPFSSPAELRRRAGLSSRALNLLAAADAFHSLMPRRQALWRSLGSKGELALFRDSLFEESWEEGSQGLQFPKESEAEQIFSDIRHTGLSLRRHPVALLRQSFKELGAESSRDLQGRAHGRRICVAGWVVLRQMPSTAKGVMFLTLEDEFGSMNLIVPPPVVKRRRRVLRQQPLIMVTGKVEREREVLHILVRSVEALPASLLPIPVVSRNFH